MNIPLDRLYQFIENIAQEIYNDCVIIYRFYPHGSKNINNLQPLHSLDSALDLNQQFINQQTHPKIMCFDQEPTNSEFYDKTSESLWPHLKLTNINTYYDEIKYGLFEKHLLLHSEKRIDKFDDDSIPVYYWSHGVIARDWFRYAEHEKFQKDVKKTFLIYNRAWSGTREYRIKFVDLLIEHNLVDKCHTTFNAVDPESAEHYTAHTFKNQHWRPEHKLENYLNPTIADATSSADFVTDDYNSTDIEVVLETLFDTLQLHLTEKILRPIACKQPFILAGTHGSLEYLRSYGFKTFGHVWDESYDQIENPIERLACITKLMQQITNWSQEERASKMLQAQQIADYNHQWFFSEEFFDLVINELRKNLKFGFDELESCNNYVKWIENYKIYLTHPLIVEWLKVNQASDVINTPGYASSQESMDIILSIAENKLKEKSNKKII